MTLFKLEMQMDFRIAITLTLVACGGVPKKQKPAAKPLTPASERLPAQAGAQVSGPSVLIGWYCPESAAGRPGVEPLLARDPTWTNDQAVLDRAIDARRAKRFSVLGYQGQSVGNLSVAGGATSAGVKLAIGSYLGAEPCDVVDSLGKVRSQNAECWRTTRGCSLAVGMLEAAGGFKARPYEEDPEAVVLVKGAACEIGENLIVDVDGDGRAERFSLSEIMAGRSPVELPLQDEGGRTCEMSFAGAVSEESTIVRVGVLDLDGDGRPEIVYRNATELLLYGAPNSPARMELLGRATLTSSPK
jgi:hypothetical protein